jgi:hypothetical protein
MLPKCGKGRKGTTGKKYGRMEGRKAKETEGRNEQKGKNQ